MKRALRSFGVQFGNSLYGSQSAQAQPKKTTPSSPPRQTTGRGSGTSELSALRKKLIDLGAEQGFDKELVRSMVKERAGKDMDDLTKAELTPLVESAERKLRERRRAA